MSGFDGFLGNERLIERLKHDIENESLSHAYIIEGKRGYGKNTLAKLICAAVSCTGDERPCMKCISCDKISRMQSPDVVIVEADRDRVQLGVDVIRRLREDAYFAPVDLPMKFYIIPNGEAMNTQAQNALLKILEEPPCHVMFLILCDNAEVLLTTIRSRAPTLRLEPIPDEIIEEFIKKNTSEVASLSEDELKAAVKLSRGSIGHALELTSKNNTKKSLELYKKAERLISLLAERKTAADELEFYEYASKLVTAKGREDAAAIYSLAADGVRDMINAKLTANPQPIFYATQGIAEEMAGKFSINALMRLGDIFTAAVTAVSGNVNLSLTLVKTACDAAKRIHLS